MKKPVKLVVRRETIRELRDLELTRVVGGDTGDKACTSDILPRQHPATGA